MKRAFLTALVVVALAGCAKPALPVLTQTTQGEPVLKTEVPRTGARADVPAGTDPKDVIVIETASGAKGYLAKKPKKHLFDQQEFEFYANPQAQAEGMKATQPKRSWRWLWITVLTALAVAALVLLGMKFKGPLTAVLGFFRRRK